MKNVQKKSWVIRALPFAFICFFAFLFIGCGEGDEAKLVGKWVDEAAPDNFELFKDGIGLVEKYSINWKIENNRFIITSPQTSIGAVYNYTVSDSVLIFISDKGDSSKYYNYAWLERRKLPKATIVDKRDGKKYKTLKFGKQVWMTENLNYAASGSKCYNNDPDNCEKYGRLYDWKTAMEACPDGWHLPSNTEWEELIEFVGDEKVAGIKLKTKKDWNDFESKSGNKSGNGTDYYGFSALPGGGGRSGGSFYAVGNYGYWWSATENNSDGAYYRNMGYPYSEVGSGNDYKTSLYSVRCIKD